MSPLLPLASRALLASSSLSSLFSSPPPAGLVLHNSLENGTLVASWADVEAPQVKLEGEGAGGGFVAITVVKGNEGGRASCEWVKEQVERFREADDVFTDDFLSGSSSFASVDEETLTR
jgi:hypothetical protein